MKKNIFIICLVMALVGLTAASVFAASAEDELASERKLMDMERRIFIDKLATQRESFEDKARRLETKVIQLERDLEHVTNGSDKRIEDLRSHMNERVDDASSHMEMIFLLYSGGFAILLAVLGFLGWKTVKEMAEGRIKKLITEDFVKEIIEEKGQAAIDKLVCSLEEKGKSGLEEILEKVKSEGLERLSKEDKEKVSESAESTSKSKDESSYTDEDWFVRGLDEYEKGLYKEAAE